MSVVYLSGEPSLSRAFPLHRIMSSALIELDLVATITLPPKEDAENETEEDEETENQSIQPTIELINTLTNAQLEDLAKEWIRPMQKILMVYKQKEPIDDSPISEYELWQMQETEFKNIIENMEHPFVVAVQSKFNHVRKTTRY